MTCLIIGIDYTPVGLCGQTKRRGGWNIDADVL